MVIIVRGFSWSMLKSNIDHYTTINVYNSGCPTKKLQCCFFSIRRKLLRFWKILCKTCHKNSGPEGSLTLYSSILINRPYTSILGFGRSSILFEKNHGQLRGSFLFDLCHISKFQGICPRNFVTITVVLEILKRIYLQNSTFYRHIIYIILNHKSNIMTITLYSSTNKQYVHIRHRNTSGSNTIALCLR
jgi:hypothetical protein